MSCLWEGPRSFELHSSLCWVWLPLLGSVGQFFWGCLSHGAVFLAMLALGLVSWPGLGPLLFLPDESLKGKSSN